MNETHEERISILEQKVAELERLLLTASKGKARTCSVLADCQAAAAVTLPLSLQGKAFQEKWQEFCRYRCDIATKGTINRKKHPWTPRAATAIIRTCEDLGPLAAIAAMEFTMAKGWVDLYPAPDPHFPPPPANQARPHPNDARSRRSMSL